MTPGPLVDPDTVPAWLAPLTRGSAALSAGDLARASAPPTGRGRPAAVLVLLAAGEPDGDPDMLLLRRSDGLAAHAGQVAFPGGALDGDEGPVTAALREADEEVGVRPADVRPVALLPELYVPPSDFVVTPVLAHWVRPGPVHPVDARETAAVARVPVRALADPGNRVLVRGGTGSAFPAFVLPGMLVWGFTGGLVAAVLAMGGWERPWDDDRVHDVDAAWRMAEETGVGW